MASMFINPFTDPESIMETCSVVLTFESVDEILWCDHLNETSLALLLHGTICFSIFYSHNEIWNFSRILYLALLVHVGNELKHVQL